MIVKRLLLVPVLVLNLRHELLKRLEASLALHFFYQSDTPGCLIRFIVRVRHRPAVGDKFLSYLRLFLCILIIRCLSFFAIGLFTMIVFLELFI